MEPSHTAPVPLAHPDIAFEFGMWSSPEFKIYLVREFRRLKDEENDRLKLGWNLQRTLAKINYRIHTDAIKESLIPPAVTKAQANLVYASEADLLNVALFGQTAKQWRDTHPEAEGNVRDHAPLEQLVAGRFGNPLRVSISILGSCSDRTRHAGSRRVAESNTVRGL